MKTIVFIFATLTLFVHGIRAQTLSCSSYGYPVSTPMIQNTCEQANRGVRKANEGECYRVAGYNANKAIGRLIQMFEAPPAGWSSISGIYPYQCSTTYELSSHTATFDLYRTAISANSGIWTPEFNGWPQSTEVQQAVDLLPQLLQTLNDALTALNTCSQRSCADAVTAYCNDADADVLRTAYNSLASTCN